MRRIATILLVGAAALIAACRDSIVAPARSPAATNPAAVSYSKNNHSTLLDKIEISPEGGTYRVGDFEVVIPAGAVCDPATTKYGRAHWDRDCAPAGRSITVNVVAERHGDRVAVDFQPDLRFRPSAGPVVLQTRAYAGLLTSDAVRQLGVSSAYFNRFLIAYVPSGSGKHVDEVRDLGDRSLVTHVDLRTGLVWRRVKHFSGYMVTSGFACMPSMEDPCTIEDPVPGGLTETKAVESSLILLISDLMLSASIDVTQ